MFGFINAFKPPGITSTAFGSFVRRLLGGVAVGHWGTLDPAATGVLVLAAGQATRLLPLLSPSTKQYVFELIVGEATDTGDATGRVIADGKVPTDWRDHLPAVASSLVGPLEQVPPMFSAVKVDGRPLYVSARRGRNIARSARTTRIFDLRVLGAVEFIRPNVARRANLESNVARRAKLDCPAERSSADARNRIARLLVECEAGLYVRTLCEELGKRLGVPAHMGALVRTAAGPFRLEDAHLPQDIIADARACLEDPLAVLKQPRLEVAAEQAQRFAHGNDITVARAGRPSATLDQEVLVLSGGRLIGTGRLRENANLETVAPSRVFTSVGGGEAVEAKP